MEEFYIEDVREQMDERMRESREVADVAETGARAVLSYLDVLSNLNGELIQAAVDSRIAAVRMGCSIPNNKEFNNVHRPVEELEESEE